MPDANAVNREAYSHELVSFGFWAGDQNMRSRASLVHLAGARRSPSPTTGAKGSLLVRASEQLLALRPYQAVGPRPTREERCSPSWRARIKQAPIRPAGMPASVVLATRLWGLSSRRLDTHDAGPGIWPTVMTIQSREALHPSATRSHSPRRAAANRAARNRPAIAFSGVPAQGAQGIKKSSTNVGSVTWISIYRSRPPRVAACRARTSHSRQKRSAVNGAAAKGGGSRPIKRLLPSGASTFCTNASAAFLFVLRLTTAIWYSIGGCEPSGSSMTLTLAPAVAASVA